MALPHHAEEWMKRADIDYIGPFVKAWAAFNAWYRDASQEGQERAMLNFVKDRPNTARRAILPLFDNDNDTADSLTLRQAIYDLHQYLDAIRFEVTRKNVIERISFRSVCIKPQTLQQERAEHNRQEFTAERVAGGAIEITVRSLRTGRVGFQHRQAQYDPNEVYEQRAFGDNLSEVQRTRLRQFYDGCNPRPMHDLIRGGDGPALTIGAAEFLCSAEELFSGLVEVIYAMRNALLHGEVEPDPRVLACYEPAYRVVMQFLARIG